MSISEALVADFQQEASTTRKILEAVPEDRLDWKPHEKSMSLGQLAGQIAETPGWAKALMEDELDLAGVGEDYQPFIATSRRDLLDRFEKNLAGFAAVLEGRADAFLSATWTARRGEKVLMSMPRHAALRSTAIHHIIHHRGQLTVYLRLLGVAVPQSYGPTADYPEFGC